MPGFTKVENRILEKYIPDLELSRSLASIRGIMEIIWANEVPRIVKDYTDHGEEHSNRVACLAEKLLQVNPDVKYSKQEIYLLLAGIYLHDIGMQCDIVKYPKIKEKAECLGSKFKEAFTTEITSDYLPKEQEEIRKNHHFLSAAWIDYLYENNDPVLSPLIRSVPDDLVDDLMDVCKFHSSLLINDCPHSLKYYPNDRKKMIAAFLRFADELDISRTRVKLETVLIYSIKSDNSVYWWLHNYTKVDFVGSNEVLLKIRLHPEDFELYGSLIRKDCIIDFKEKNQPVLNVLVGEGIPIAINNNSDVVADNRVIKFPPEITTIFDKKLQKNVAYFCKPLIEKLNDAGVNVSRILEALCCIEDTRSVKTDAGGDINRVLVEVLTDAGVDVNQILVEALCNIEDTRSVKTDAGGDISQVSVEILRKIGYGSS